MPTVTKTTTVGPQAIAPGEVAQISFAAPEDGTVKTPVLGEGARPIKLWVGRETSVAPTKDDVAADPLPWEVSLGVVKGGLIMLTVQNMLNEPALFSVGFPLEVNIPEEAPPPVAALTQRIPKHEETKTGLAEYGLKEGNNEVGVVFMRNEATFLLAHLREGHPLINDIRYSVIRRLDAVMKVKK